MDFRACFTMGTGGHYITMLPADWSKSTSHDPLPSSCHSEKMLWNPSISRECSTSIASLSCDNSSVSSLVMKFIRNCLGKVNVLTSECGRLL